jgi:hypothetical protein
MQRTRVPRAADGERYGRLKCSHENIVNSFRGVDDIDILQLR